MSSIFWNIEGWKLVPKGCGDKMSQMNFALPAVQAEIRQLDTQRDGLHIGHLGLPSSFSGPVAVSEFTSDEGSRSPRREASNFKDTHPFRSTQLP